MADYDLPPDLIQLQRAFWAADERRAHTEGPELIEATRKAADAAEAIHRHPWWANVDNRYKADLALKKAAREQE